MIDPNHDIVPTLRMFDGLMMDMAADEIERLRAKVAALEAAASQEAKPNVYAVNMSAERVQDSAKSEQEAKPVAATGFAWVPVEPTGMMKDAGVGSLPLGAGPWNAADCYRAMIGAAPQEQAPLNAQALKNAYFGIKHALQQVAAARDVVAERQRQKDVEEWSEDHDDEHDDEALALAAAWYALPDVVRSALDVNDMSLWPQAWDLSYFKPGNRRRELVKAGALILAEIERIDRAVQQSQPQQVTK